jgi:hypothetical protein
VKSSEIEERADRLIDECRELDIEPTPQTIAEIMVDQGDVRIGEEPSPEAAEAYVAFRKAAATALQRKT